MNSDMKPTIQSNPIPLPKSKPKKQEPKEKPEIIVEKMEGGILVRRYKGKKVEIEKGR
jgi:hypothetical protein